MNTSDYRVIRIIRDVDFLQWPDDPKDHGIDENDNCFVNFKKMHGTVIYVAGLIEGDEDDLLCMGAPEGSNEFRIAVYGPFMDFEVRWLRLLGKEELAKEREKQYKLNMADRWKITN